MDDWSFCPKCGTKFDPEAKQCSNCGAATPSATTVASGDIPSATDSDLEALESELREALAPGLQLVNRMGQGGMGTVFRARDPALKRNVVVKVLSPELAHDPTARARFAREAESAAAVSHPNVINVYSVGELPQSGTSYFVMQHVDGPTLAEEFPEGTAVPEARAKQIVGEVASALAAAHGRGLVHRDIKPNNIMIERDSGRAIVLDFGISAAITPELAAKSTKLTVQGSSIGTPQYMSPEQAAGQEVTGASDVYSLGLVAFELVAGRPPFDESNAMALIAAHINKEPPSVSTLRPELDTQLSDLIDQCLTKSAQERPTTAELSRALTPPIHATIEWPPPGLVDLRRLGRGVRRSAMAVVAAITLAFLVQVIEPTVASHRWWIGEESDFWKAFHGDSDASTFYVPDTLLTTSLPSELSGVRGAVELAPGSTWSNRTLMWLFLKDLSGWAMAFIGLWFLYRSALLLRGMRAGIKLGYPWAQLSYVCFDQYADTAELLNGTGRYSLISADNRRRVLRLRHFYNAVWIAAVCFGIVAPALWVFGLFGGLEDATVVPIPAVEWVVTMLPLIACALTMAALRVRELRLAGRSLLLLRLPRIGSTSLPQVAPVLVEAWLGSAEALVLPGSRKNATYKLALGMTLLVGGTLIVFYATEIMNVVGYTATAASLRGRERALEWASSFLRDPPVAWYTIDSALQSRDGLGDDEIADTLAAQAFTLSFLQDSSMHDGGFISVRKAQIASYLNIPGPNVQTPHARLINRAERPIISERLQEAWERLPGRLSDSIRTLLVADAVFPDYEVLSALAYSGRLPATWPYREGFPGATSPSDLQMITPSTDSRSLFLPFHTFDWLRETEAAVVLALDRGDRAEALRRSRELFAVGRHLTSVPFEPWSLFGRVFLRRSIRLQRNISEVLQDTILLQDVVRWEEILTEWQEEHRRLAGFWPAQRALMSDPAHPIGLNFVADRSVPPRIRMELIREIGDGFCANSREILFGVDKQRLLHLDQAEMLAADIESVSEWVELIRKWFRSLIEHPRRVTPNAFAEGNAYRNNNQVWFAPLAWVGLGGLRNRMRYCRDPWVILPWDIIF